VDRNAARSSAWPALHLSLTFSKLLGANPAWHLAAHRANFWAGAFRRMQLILRSGGSGVGGVERSNQKKGLKAKTLDATPRSTSQPTTQIFKHLFQQVHSARCN